MSAKLRAGASEPSGWRLWLEIIVFAGTYFCASATGMHLMRTHGESAIFWPSAGLAITALLARGYRLWPGIALGALAAYWSDGMPLNAAATIMVGNVLEAVFGAWCYRRILAQLTDTAGAYGEPAAAFFTGLFAPLPSVAAGAFGLFQAYHLSAEKLPGVLGRWWLGDMTGTLVVLPICLGFVGNARSLPVRAPRFVAKMAAILGAVVATCWLVFFTPTGLHLMFAIFPLILLGGLWLGQAGTQIVSAIIVVSSLVALEYGPGSPYAIAAGKMRMEIFVVYLVSVGLTTKMVAVLVQQRALAIPGRIMFLGWMLGGCLFSYLAWEEEKLSSLRFDQLIDDTEQVISDRLGKYEEALSGGAAFLAANPEAGRRQWHAFASALRLQERYPGIRGIGIIEPVRGDQVAGLAAELSGRDLAEFRVHDIDQRPDFGGDDQQVRYVITHISPIARNAPALGLNVASEPRRKLAAELARDTGRARMTGNISLVQDGGNRPGFLLMVPVYEPGRPTATVAERRAALRCWVYAPFVIEEFFSGVLGKLPYRPLVTVLDPNEGSEPTPLAKLDERATRGESGTERDTQLVLAGRTFTMRWSQPKADTGKAGAGPVWAGAVASLVTLLVAALTASLQGTAAQANRLAEQRTREIQAINEQLKEQFAELSRTQGDLLSLQRVHQNVLESVGDGIYAIDVEGKFIMQNGSSASLLGWSSAEVIGRTAHELIHHHRIDDHLYPASDCPINATIRDGQVRRVENEVFWRRDGSSFPVEYTTAPLLNEAGAVVGATVTFKDITERKRLEVAQAAMLARARELADMKSRFISVTSHEFRTPLQVVESAVQLLEHHYPKMGPAKVAQLYARVRGSLQRMTGLLEDLLILNRLDAQRAKVTPVKTEIIHYVQDLIEERRMTDPTHQFLVHAPAGSAEILVDVKLLYHAISNLLGNAVRYSAPGSTVTTRLRFDGDILVLSIADQGIGIPQEDRERIFEAFERGANVGHVGGTGLGLNIVRRVIELLGGQVTVESEMNRGSTFTVTVPITRPPAAADHAQA